MKRLTLTLLSVYLPACSTEGGGSPFEFNDAGGSDTSAAHSAEHSEVVASTGSSSQVAPKTNDTGATSNGSDRASSESRASGGSSGTQSSTTSGPSTSESSDTSDRSTGSGSNTGTQSASSAPSSSASTNDSTGSDATNDATSGTSDSSDTQPLEPAFDIDLVFLDDAEASNAVVDAFERAEAFWEELIVGDLPDVTTRRQSCNGPEVYVEGDIDDLQIFVAVGIMDGPDGVLGAAGPCLGRASQQGGLPLAGFMQFDSEDLERYADQGRLDEVIIHEMGHVLGFGGVLWQQQGFLADPSQGNMVLDTHFTGEKAIAAFDAIGGNAYTDSKVPVENTGGMGTANGHWREGVMGNEMMTSYMTNMEAVLSTVTLAALEDMGYEVDYSKAGGYEWPPPDERGRLFSLRSEPELPVIDFSNDILDIPFVTLEP